jgi:hypothetical protein
MKRRRERKGERKDEKEKKIFCFGKLKVYYFIDVQNCAQSCWRWLYWIFTMKFVTASGILSSISYSHKTNAIEIF